ncbi:SCO4225 family membrane protein [Streptomyces sp. NPDC003635]
MGKDSRTRRLLALASDNWGARGYWALFTASVGVAFAAPDSVVASLPLLLTAPWSSMAIFVPIDPGADATGAAQVLALSGAAVWLLLCALVNAAAFGALTHHVRDSRAARHA